MKKDSRSKKVEDDSNRPEDEFLGIAPSVAYGLQHELTMYGGIVAVPLIIGQAAGLAPADIGILIAAALFMGGAGDPRANLGHPLLWLPVAAGEARIVCQRGDDDRHRQYQWRSARGIWCGQGFGGNRHSHRARLRPVFGSFSQSAFAQNVGLVAVTGVKSRFVVAASGIILVTLGLLPVMGRVIAAVPMSLLGGAGVVLFGTVAASGMRTLAKVEYAGNMNLIIVATSIGFGMIAIAAPSFYHHFPSWFETIFHSGISSAAVMAILLNLLFNHMKAGNIKGQSVFVAGTDRILRKRDVACLAHGDHFIDGKLFNAEGDEIPIVDEAAGAH